MNHKTQYPIDSSGGFNDVCLNNVDFIISGLSSITGNFIKLKVEKWESTDSEGLRYNITYFLGKYINEEYIEQTFLTLDEVVNFIEGIEPPVSPDSET